MTLNDWLKTMQGRWLTVYTLDVCVGEDGKPLAHVGQLLQVGTDFIELVATDGFRSVIGTQYLCSAHERTDQDKLTLEAQENAEKKTLEAMARANSSK